MAQLWTSEGKRAQLASSLSAQPLGFLYCMQAHCLSHSVVSLLVAKESKIAELSFNMFSFCIHFS